MYTAPPTTAFMVLSIVCILMLSTIPLLAVAVYQQPEITSPSADTVGDAKINAENGTIDTNVPKQ